MTTGDGQLSEMIRTLAEMSSPDRAYIVEQLGKSEASLLEPYLKRLEVRSMSPALQALVADCTDERTPEALTPRAAAALRMAAASELPVASHPRARTGRDRAPWRNRLSAWLEER